MCCHINTTSQACGIELHYMAESMFEKLDNLHALQIKTHLVAKSNTSDIDSVTLTCGFCRISEYMDLSPAEVVGRTCYHFIHAEDLDTIRQSHEDCKPVRICDLPATPSLKKKKLIPHHTSIAKLYII